MQRERLEGWMVRQIEQADLARDTVIQMPPRPMVAMAKSPFSSPRGAAAPEAPRRRRFGHDGPPRRPYTTPATSRTRDSSGGHDTNHRTLTPRTRLETAVSALAEPDGHDSVARQWRLHFQDPEGCYVEEGSVDRTKVLKDFGWGSPRGEASQGAYPTSPRNDDGHDGFPDEYASRTQAPSSPLALWSMPREYILEYIRQSIMPTFCATHARFTGEWEAVLPSDPDNRYVPRETELVSTPSAALPPLGTQRATKASTIMGYSSPHSPRHASQSSVVSVRRSAPAASAPPPTSPRVRPPRCEERIQQILQELRADPKLLDAFQKEVKQYLDERRQKQHASNKIRENRQRALLSPRAPAILAERKRRNEDRFERTRRQRQQLDQQDSVRRETLLMAFRQKVYGKENPENTVDVTLTASYRRRKMWLVVLAFAKASTQLRERLLQTKQRQIVERMQIKAARTIQLIWKRWKWRHASQHTVVIYSWLRKCLWKLLFRIRCRRKARQGAILRRFLLDQCTSSRETRNFNSMMLRWRSKVIHSQRHGMNFVLCTRARLHALSIWWDSIDHERQRNERQLHDKLLPTTDEKEAEWNAIIHNRRLSMRSSAMGASSRALNFAAASPPATPRPNSPSPSTTATPTPVAPSTTPGIPPMLSRRTTSTRQILDQMGGRLTTMQQVLTPIEIQRLQQHAFHVVRIPRAIKMRLLVEHLTQIRKAYVRQLTAYHDQIACSSYAREVRLDDARAIVQGGASWDALLVDSRTGQPQIRKPIFQLYTGEKLQRQMEELVRRGVMLTLESDPAQRAIVDRQRQQRQAFEAAGNTLGPSALGTSVNSPRVRVSSNPGMAALNGISLTARPPTPPTLALDLTVSNEGEPRKRPTRKLQFALPAAIREKPQR
ncbi:hypothetical protein Poli38472_002927 [Pythium oligandrum]|uniref:Uncharacterized protein n=1 Tax=Pythium oligandrum TaxID=41045 RepID=A0A8K1FEU4_PYTOL|nr:hypothetical protein Poli38472_002927 [Pythium oligandrum]|eukprot:TMW57002.1 hypothetical protein Poli38472_002927 [Pythium oligandrum]